MKRRQMHRQLVQSSPAHCAHNCANPQPYMPHHGCIPPSTSWSLAVVDTTQNPLARSITHSLTHLLACLLFPAITACFMLDAALAPWLSSMRPAQATHQTTRWVSVQYPAAVVSASLSLSSFTDPQKRFADAYNADCLLRCTCPCSTPCIISDPCKTKQNALCLQVRCSTRAAPKLSATCGSLSWTARYVLQRLVVQAAAQQRAQHSLYTHSASTAITRLQAASPFACALNTAA